MQRGKGGGGGGGGENVALNHHLTPLWTFAHEPPVNFWTTYKSPFNPLWTATHEPPVKLWTTHEYTWFLQIGGGMGG